MKNLPLLLVFWCLCAFPQNYSLPRQSGENAWRGFFSYNEIVAMAAWDDGLIAAGRNSLFTYDFTTHELKTISSINGLSGELISALHYSPEHRLIVVGYETGLLEVVMDDGQILKVVDVLNNSSIQPSRKVINHFNEYNGRLYIATGYGISVYNLATLEFGDTYYIGDLGQHENVNATAVHNSLLYASMDNQMKRAPAENSDLIDYSQWQSFYSFGTHDLQAFRGNLYALDDSNNLLVLNGNDFITAHSFSQGTRSLTATSQNLSVTTWSDSYTFDTAMNQTHVNTFVMDFPGYLLSTSLVLDGKLYLATNRYGVLEVPLGQILGQQIMPDGPLYNFPFALDATPGQLWVVYGEVTPAYNPWPLNRRGMSRFYNNAWHNIPFEELPDDQASMVHVAISPGNPSVAYASSMFNGMLRIVDGQPGLVFNTHTTALEPHHEDTNTLTTRTYGAAFDQQDNLWFVQSGTAEGLHRLSPGGQLQSIDLTDIIPVPDNGLNKMVIARDGSVFFAAYKNGVVGYNPASGSLRKIGTGQGNGNLSHIDTKALAIDANNQLWIGSRRGLRVTNTGSFFQQGTPPDTQPIIILDGDIGQELMYQQTITDIEVDGSNNKWVATASAGVFYFSPNGQETLLYFNKDNSPLPSNNVNDIAIDPASGLVYFATDRGLVAYTGSATAPGDNLRNLHAFPNPVRPGYTGYVTIAGLTANANVKITDVTGSLVHEQTARGGSILWDTTAFGRHRVASGVYFIMATTSDASETKIAKVMIVR